ncbi:phage holin family protein [Streptomyces sp. rh34]|uniref:phage holin family protein n=1 Tax=Streptomyces sp. rh34 TaxID=2034272 RepID=UPI000BF23E10|nr:phage holin family protein [Streptomyces sp. rh34]
MSDEYVEFWAARAKTPQTRARIRRLSRFDDISSGILLAGVGLFMLMNLASIVLAIWFWIADVSRYDIFPWGFGIALGVTAIGAILNSIAESRLSQARFADAYCSVGVIDKVRSWEGHDGEGSPTTFYKLAVTATLPDGVTIRRHIDCGTGGGSGSPDRPDETWVGRRICFRHNSVDPDDLADEQFAGWPDHEEKGALP